jgi:hypothetical protein
MNEAGLGGVGGSACSPHRACETAPVLRNASQGPLGPARPLLSPHGERSALRTSAAALDRCWLLLDLTPVGAAMPRRQKFLLGARTQTQAQDVMDAVMEAANTKPFAPGLCQANGCLHSIGLAQPQRRSARTSRMQVVS